MQTCRVVAVAVLAVSLFACSSSTSRDAGSIPTTSPTTPVSVSVAISPPGTEEVPVAASSGPVTGSVTFPPVTVPPGTSGDLTVSFLSGSSVAFERATPPQPQSSARQRNSETTLPGGPYIFEMTVTASFGFTLASVPAFDLNLGTVGEANASYVLVVEVGTSAYQFPVASQNDVISFPGSAPPLTVAAGAILKFGIALASGIPAAPTITSFTASPSSLPDAGGSVTLAWNVSGATALSIDNGVGSVTPLTSGTVTPTVTATTPFTLSATNGNGISVATASVCVAGLVTASVTSPTSYTQCTDPFLTTITMTNGSCQVVTITVIGFVSTAGTCGYSGPNDYTSANANLPFSVDAGATEVVFNLPNGLIGCCATEPCTVSCDDTYEWTLMTNIGPISAAALPFTIDVTNCSFGPYLTMCGP